MLRRAVIALAALVVLLLSFPHADVVGAVQPINFVRGTLGGAGFATTNPSTLAVGPDGRLYVADTNGGIQALTIDPTTKAVTSVQQITTNADLQEVFGIAFDPSDTSSPPPIYVTNTVSGFGDAGQAPPGSFPGKVTKISGPGYVTRTDVITGLPVSNSGHEANGLAFGPDGRLYIAQGSTTNAGVVNPNPGLFQRPEVPTSGAILVADIHAPGFNGNITYSPATLYDDSVNQTGGAVSVYAPGFRNPYDIVWHSNGRFYGTDNGPNLTYGPGSASCSTAFPTDAAELDELDLVEAGKYYGHPNRNRGRTDPRQCIYHPNTEPGSAEYTAPIEPNLPASSDGIVEYRSNKFGGQMQGDLLYAAWVNSELHRVKLSANGLSVVSDTTLASGLTNALDVTVDNSDGTIYVAEYGGNRITYFKPDETPVSSISVTSINPSGGPVAGGQTVTITGTNFTTSAETTANIGGAPITNLIVQNSTTISGVTSASSSGTKSVSVTNSIGTGALANAYNYTSGGGSTPPVANAGPDVITPIAHEDHAHVTLDARASYDPDGFIASYRWSENGVTLSTFATDSKQFTLGTHVVTLTVTDNDNFIATDEVRITVTATAVNPDPYYCFDANGDGAVDNSDLTLVANDYGMRFGAAGYSRLRDWNGDRVVNSADVMGTQADFTASCPLVDRQIRASTAAVERYQDVRVAQAEGFYQVTQYVDGQGRHMLKNSLVDGTFDAAAPESLLYEPDASTPGGWRLGGVMYYIPKSISPIPPDGFAGTDDAWHYHAALCFYPNGTVTLDSQSVCQANGGSYQTDVGWLVHLWNYHVNPTGRFVEVNNSLTKGPAASSAAVVIDADPATAGVQSTRSGATGAMTVDVVASGVNGIGAFNFDVVYNPAVFSAPTITAAASTDRNPDANQAFLESTGRSFSCTPPDPNGGIVSGANRAARIVCTSSGGTVAGADATAPQKIATVTLNVLSNADNSPLTLANVNVFNVDGSNELASCNPTVSVTTSCSGATVSTTIGSDSDGDGCPDGRELGSEHVLGGDRDPASAWDFADVPVPALTAAQTTGTRNKAITLGDVSAVLTYVGTSYGNNTINAAGAGYMTDRNHNGVLDGYEYDRTPSTVAGKLWRAGPANNVVTLSDVSVILAAVGDHCT